MNVRQTTARLTLLARAMIASLGVDPAAITECENDDIDGTYVNPPVPDGDRCWYLGTAGTDCEYVDEPGIDLIVIRPRGASSDLQEPLRGLDHLVRLLVQEGHLPEETTLKTYAVRRYRSPGRVCGMGLVRAVSADAAQNAAAIMWPGRTFRVVQAEAAF